MSRYYEMMLGVRGATPDRVDAIKEGVEAEWPFDEWEPWGDPNDSTSFFAAGRDNLCAGVGEQEFAARLGRVVWEANGGYCEVEVRATYLEELPCETYRFDEGEYEELAGKAAVAVADTARNGATPNRKCIPDLPQPQQEDHHG